MTNYINRPEAEQTRFLREQEKLKEKRKCFKCEREFISLSIANRICSECKRGDSWGSHCESYSVFK